MLLDLKPCRKRQISELSSLRVCMDDVRYKSVVPLFFEREFMNEKRVDFILKKKITYQTFVILKANRTQK